MQNNFQKIILKINDLKAKIQPKFTLIDQKIQNIIPNSKLRKTLYITVVSFVCLFLILMTIGLLVGPVQKSEKSSLNDTNKIKINTTNPPTTKMQTENQKILNQYATKIKELKFPEGELSTPLILFDLEIDQSR